MFWYLFCKVFKFINRNYQLQFILNFLYLSVEPGVRALSLKSVLSPIRSGSSRIRPPVQFKPLDSMNQVFVSISCILLSNVLRISMVLWGTQAALLFVLSSLSVSFPLNYWSIRLIEFSKPGRLNKPGFMRLCLFKRLILVIYKLIQHLSWIFLTYQLPDIPLFLNLLWDALLRFI